MIKIEHIDTYGWEAAIRGMRNPMNSWDKSDSRWKLTIGMNEITVCSPSSAGYTIGSEDARLMKTLVAAGTDHSKFMRQIGASMDITAPLYWWKEFDTYKVGTTANSCSTMHKIHEMRFEREDFSIEHIHNFEEHHWMVTMDNVISSLNAAREKYLETKDKKYWWQMIQLLPSSYNQRRTVTLNYAVLRNQYHARKNHKLDEWRDYCRTIEACLPYAELITMEDGGQRA